MKEIEEIINNALIDKIIRKKGIFKILEACLEKMESDREQIQSLTKKVEELEKHKEWAVDTLITTPETFEDLIDDLIIKQNSGLPFREALKKLQFVVMHSMNDQEQTISDLKEEVKQLKIDNGELREQMFNNGLNPK